MKFFLTAIWRVAEAAASTATEILGLRESHRKLIQDLLPGSVNGVELLDRLFRMPYTTVNLAADELGVSYPTANNVINSLVGLNILDEVTGRERNRRFRYSSYLDLMDRGFDLTAFSND